MAVLTRTEILERMREGSLAFTPTLDTFQLQAHAVDLRLGTTFLLPKSWHLTPEGREALRMDYFSPRRPEYFDTIELKPGQYFDLLPGEHVLVSSLEAIKMPSDIMAVMYPRTSTNRKGISVDQTGIIDSGYEGQLIIPILNGTQSQVVRLYPGERFCQLVFEDLTHAIEARKSRYHQRAVRKGVSVGGLTREREIEIELIKQGDLSRLKIEYPA